MSPPNGSGEATSATDEIVTSALPALGWARVLLIAKQHGVLVALCLMMAYQIGVIASAQNYVCGV
jgi:hypothetical protein